MTSIALVATGLLCVLAGGYGFLDPQRQHEIRQWGQSRGDPELSDFGKLAWRVLDLALLALGLGVVWFGVTL